MVVDEEKKGGSDAQTAPSSTCPDTDTNGSSQNKDSDAHHTTDSSTTAIDAIALQDKFGDAGGDCEESDDMASVAHAIYFSQAFQAFGDRIWAFTIPMAFIEIFPTTLLPVALYGFAGFFAQLILLPSAGGYLDRTDRMEAVRTSLFIQNASVIASMVMLYLVYVVAEDGGYSEPRDWTFEQWLFFCLLVCTSVISELTGAVCQMSVEKDWVVIITENNKPFLTKLNATMRRIDLVCKMTAPIVVGLLFEFLSEDTELLVVTIGSVVSVWNVASLFPEYFMLRNVYLTYPALQVTKEAMKQRAEQRRKEQEEGEEEGKQEEEEKDVGHAKAIEMGELALAEESEGGKDKPEGSKEGEGEGEGDEEEEKLPSASKACTSTNPLVVLYQGWSQYMTHAIFLPSLSYAFLYLTVLDSSSLTIAYLKWLGISDGIIGASGAFGAVFGIVGTFLFPRLLACTGGLKLTGFVSVWSFFILILLAGLGFIFSEDNETRGMLMILSMILSRSSLWMYDLNHTHIMQMGVEEEARGLINSVQKANTKIAGILRASLAIAFSDPEDFDILVYMSIGSILTASSLYTVWSLLSDVAFDLTSKDDEEEEGECEGDCKGEGEGENNGKGKGKEGEEVPSV